MAPETHPPMLTKWLPKVGWSNYNSFWEVHWNMSQPHGVYNLTSSSIEKSVVKKFRQWNHSKDTLLNSETSDLVKLTLLPKICHQIFFESILGCTCGTSIGMPDHARSTSCSSLENKCNYTYFPYPPHVRKRKRATDFLLMRGWTRSIPPYKKQINGMCFL